MKEYKKKLMYLFFNFRGSELIWIGCQTEWIANLKEAFEENGCVFYF